MARCYRWAGFRAQLVIPGSPHHFNRTFDHIAKLLVRTLKLGVLHVLCVENDAIVISCELLYSGLGVTIGIEIFRRNIRNLTTKMKFP